MGLECRGCGQGRPTFIKNLSPYGVQACFGLAYLSLSGKQRETDLCGDSSLLLVERGDELANVLQIVKVLYVCVAEQRHSRIRIVWRLLPRPSLSAGRLPW